MHGSAHSCAHLDQWPLRSLMICGESACTLLLNSVISSWSVDGCPALSRSALMFVRQVVIGWTFGVGALMNAAGSMVPHTPSVPFGSAAAGTLVGIFLRVVRYDVSDAFIAAMSLLSVPNM